MISTFQEDELYEDDFHEKGLKLLSFFEELPDKAKAIYLFWNYQKDKSSYTSDNITYINGIACLGCQSPIEQIFYMAFGIEVEKRLEKESHSYDKQKDIVHSSIWIEDVEPQYKITIEDKNYFADFYIPIMFYSDDVEGHYKNLDLIIECDGHDYHHENKTQIAHDYERETNLKKEGYEVIRFTGTQIYKDPLKCADDVIDYLISEINRWINTNSRTKEEKKK